MFKESSNRATSTRQNLSLWSEEGGYSYKVCHNDVFNFKKL